MSGSYDYVSSYGRKPPPGVTRMDTPALYVGTSEKIPPFLITNTDHDSGAHPEENRKFYSLFLKHGLPVQTAVITDRTHQSQIGGVGVQLPALDDPQGEPPGADTLGPTILGFVDDVLRGLPMPNTLLKSPPASLRTVKDLLYYKGSGADPKFHSLDLYLPEGKPNFPVVFFVHGGGWRAGDKADPALKSFIETFAKIGVGVASSNYRLSPAAKHPAHIEDVAKAFAWLYGNASQYGIDRDRLFLAGHSVGGQLVGLLALNPEYLLKEGLPSGVIKGVLSLSGVYDLTNFAEIGAIPSRQEQAFSNDRKVLEEASPIHYVNRQAPPFLIAYAQNDLYSLRQEAMDFHAALLKQGVKAQLAHIPGRNHFNILAGMAQQLDQVDDVMTPTAVQFVTRILTSKGTLYPGN